MNIHIQVFTKINRLMGFLVELGIEHRAFALSSIPSLF